MLDERFKARQERRLTLLIQRELLLQQIQTLQSAVQSADREIFTCDGAMDELQALSRELPSQE